MGINMVGKKMESLGIVLALFILSVGAGCGAQDTNAVTNQVFEHDRNKDGKPDLRIETFYRGARKVMHVWSHPNTQGVMKVTSRMYLAGRDVVTMESDEDRDGFFESIVVYRSRSEDIESFTRQRDGSVRPVDAQTLAALRKQFVAINEGLDKMFDKSADPDKALEVMYDTRQKIRDAAKEKSGGN